MKDDKYHELDKQVSRQVRAELLAKGVTKYPVTCSYCDDDGRVEVDNNGPIGRCPICNGTKQYLVSI